MGEIVRTSKLVADVEGNFPELTFEVGRRLMLDDVIVVEWTCNYGDGRLYRNVTIGELKDGEAVRVTDYWGEPTETPGWRRELTERLRMPGDLGVWPDNETSATTSRISRIQERSRAGWADTGGGSRSRGQRASSWVCCIR